MSENITPLGWATRTEYAVVHWSTKDDAQAFHETYPNRVSAPEAMYAEVDVAALTARVKELEDESAEAAYLLGRLMDDLPSNRDWLDPILEEASRDYVARHSALNKEPTT